MDFAFCTLMVVLTANRIDGTKVVVSLPDSEPLAAMANAIETIANATKQDTNHWKTLEKKLESIQEHERESTKNLEMKLKSIEILLNKMTNGSTSDTESKPRHNPTPEPRLPASTAPEPEPTLPAPTEELGLIVNRGTAGASSYHRVLPPKNAFDGTSDWANRDGHFPAVIWLQFQSAHRLQKIGFAIHSVDQNLPYEFEVVGSDDCSRWNVLLRLNNRGGFRSNKEFKTFVIPAENRVSVRCIGLRWPNRNGCNGYVRVGRITMWEQV